MTDTTSEAFDLRKNGTIFLRWEGQEPGTMHERTLRRPTLGQYRRYVEELTSLGESVGGDEPDRDSGLTATVKWLTLIFNGDEQTRGIADKPLPDSIDDLPSWLVSGDVAKDLITHWQTVPSRPGAA